MKHLPHLALAVLLCTSLGAAQAGTMYRYKDDNGRTVISNTVPSDASKRGYQILNAQGRVEKTVDPAPTKEELAERAQEKQQEKRAEQQREEDAQLLRTYSHPDDAVRALRRKLQELQSLVQLKRGNIAVIESQLQEQQSKAADLERAGREVPDTLTTRIERLQSQKRDIEREIQQQDMETDRIRHSFEDKIERLEALTGEKRSLELTPEDTGANDSSD
ncbi:DUF4124 domain-containing protein [Marinobacter halodurans]|uniref:DUF4124 domain-containing protein n=1 Tax=Marinobacter halodurans TaxID=2528979 RepID=A0ABY1ZLE1_9GAMM|nr:DUF4124 domain-containing protein [Marinobacter halodurans]TBW52211.1 DUF4124 domain-containing protein [Marinobacter halodurans]